MGLSTVGICGGELDAPTAPTQVLCLSLIKWLGRMQGMNCTAFSSLCQNSFCFQGTLLLCMRLDAPCQGQAGGKCFLEPPCVLQKLLLTLRSLWSVHAGEHHTLDLQRSSCFPRHPVIKGLIRSAPNCSEVLVSAVTCLSPH